MYHYVLEMLAIGQQAGLPPDAIKQAIHAKLPVAEFRERCGISELSDASRGGLNSLRVSMPESG